MLQALWNNAVISCFVRVVSTVEDCRAFRLTFAQDTPEYTLCRLHVSQFNGRGEEETESRRAIQLRQTLGRHTTYRRVEETKCDDVEQTRYLVTSVSE